MNVLPSSSNSAHHEASFFVSETLYGIPINNKSSPSKSLFNHHGLSQLKIYNRWRNPSSKTNSKEARKIMQAWQAV